LSVLYGAYSVGVLLSTPVFGTIGDRLGYRAVMWIAAGLSVPAVALLWHSDGFTLTLIGRLFQGAASAATWTAGFALIAARYPTERVRMIGLALMASTGGSVIGPVTSGALYQLGGYSLPFVVLCAFALTDAALRFLLLPKDPPHEGGGPGLVGLMLDRSVAAPALAVAVAAGAWGILEPTLPRHLEAALGIGTAEIGLLFTLSTIVYGCAAPLVSFATGRFGIMRIAIAGLVMMAATLPLLGLAPTLAICGAILCLVNIAFAFMLNPTSAELGDAVERRGLSCYGAVYAIYNISYALGMMSASTLSASLSERFSAFQILLCVSAILLLCIPLLLAANRRVQPVPEVP
jgi:MFS family permease